MLLDTNVFSRLFTRRPTTTDESATAWRTVLLGVGIAISFQTRQEVLAGAYSAHWGDSRLATLSAQLERTVTVWADPSVVETCARLHSTCRAMGHPLHQPVHTADRWIAACALAFQLSLATEDAVFDDVPELQLLSRKGAHD